MSEEDRQPQDSEPGEHNGTEPSGRPRGLAVKVGQEVRYIEDSFAAAGPDNAHIVTVPADGGVDLMYADNQVLVRYEYLEGVREILRGRYTIGAVEPVIGDIALQHLELRERGEGPERDPDGKGNGDGADQPVLLRDLEAIQDRFGEGVATPNHLLTVASGGGEVGPCPATEPEEVTDGIEPSPGVCGGNSGAGTLIFIADTGLLKGADAAHSWLRDVRRAHRLHGQQLQDWDPLGPPGTNGQPTLSRYTGHGTFVAGVARCLAPQADVIVSNIFKVAGSRLESHLARRLGKALGLGVDVFQVSATARTWQHRPLLAFAAWLDVLRGYQGVVCVAPAGNSGTRRPAWPAAFPGVVSVGALAADGRDRASFSDYGGWVDVYAPGRNLINAYATGTYTCMVAPYTGTRQFYGMARWSGTSFSTPIVTGLIAARMSRTGENGRQAAAALLAVARSQAIPGVGAVLFPCDGRGGLGRPCGAECCGAHRCRPGDC